MVQRIEVVIFKPNPFNPFQQLHEVRVLKLSQQNPPSPSLSDQTPLIDNFPTLTVVTQTPNADTITVGFPDNGPSVEYGFTVPRRELYQTEWQQAQPGLQLEVETEQELCIMSTTRAIIIHPLRST